MAATCAAMGLVHHTDGEREWAYDRTSPVGRLDKAGVGRSKITLIF
jgi:hypothetical protein